MPALSILIKPSSSACNLNCRYCFYYDVAEHREINNYGMMKDETIETIVKKAFDYGEHVITFSFQGGEPTLIGLPFYENFVLLVEKYNQSNIMVNYSIQTNGTLLDDAWCTFLHEHHFLVGVSLDGPHEIHNINRQYPGEKNSFKKARKSITLLENHKVEFNILTVVSKDVALNAKKIYQYFRKEDFMYLQFIPCLDEFNQSEGLQPFSLTPKDYGTFLCTLFDEWYKDFVNGRRISIRMFDNILQIMLGYPPESCDMAGRCSANAVIESDGSVYPCDFYVLDEWKLGNILDDDLDILLHSKSAKAFVESSFSLPSTCQKCSYIRICRSGCRRHQEMKELGNIGENYFCESYKKFYEYTLPRFQEIAKYIISTSK